MSYDTPTELYVEVDVRDENEFQDKVNAVVARLLVAEADLRRAQGHEEIRAAGAAYMKVASELFWAHEECRIMTGRCSLPCLGSPTPEGG